MQKLALCLLMIGLFTLKSYAQLGGPPVIIVQPLGVSVLNMGTATFTVVAASLTTLSYQWYFNGNPIGGATSSLLTFSKVGSKNAGNYFVKVSNASGTVTSSVVVLSIGSDVSIDQDPQDTTVVQGQNASFDVSVSGSSPYYYQWSFNGTNLLNATNAILSLTNVQAAQAGDYAVVVTNDAGSSSSSQSAALTILIPPSITSPPQSLTVIQGHAASFTVTAAGDPYLQYQWYFNGAKLGGGSTSSTLTLNSANTNNAGNYTVVVKNYYGSVTSQVATLTVTAPPYITAQPQGVLGVVGQSVSLSVAAGGTAPFNYKWYFQNALLTNATNNTLSLNALALTNAGNYRVVISSSWGSTTSAVAAVTVTNFSVALSSGGNSGGLSAQGFSFQISTLAGHTYVVFASTNFTHWTPIATNVASASSVTFTDRAATNRPACYYRAAVW